MDRAGVFYTVVFPIVFFLFLLAADRPFPGFLPGLTASELGLLENIQALVLLAAFVLTLRLLWRTGAQPLWLGLWLGAGAAGALYSMYSLIFLMFPKSCSMGLKSGE